MQFAFLFCLILCLEFCSLQPFDIFSTDPVRTAQNETVKRSYFPYELQWQKFKKEYGKQYSPSEDRRRRQIFMETVKQIEAHNQRYIDGKETYYQDINQFSDMTIEEYRLRTGLMMRSDINRSECSSFLTSRDVYLPTQMDWRKKGYVTAVQDQGHCGSCWAFSSTGSMEGQHFRKTGKLLKLSEQQLVDCSRSFGNDGCGGGFETAAYQYIKKFGIESERDYPYKAKDMTCQYDKKKAAVRCTGCSAVKSGSESDLLKAVATIGPISVSIDASQRSFKSYKGGIYDDPKCSSTYLIHAMLVVGYGNQNGKDYWIVKNSHGKFWGNGGYIYMSRNKRNQCGIASEANYPLI